MVLLPLANWARIPLRVLSERAKKTRSSFFGSGFMGTILNRTVNNSQARNLLLQEPVSMAVVCYCGRHPNYSQEDGK
jgi:hypothetical protein